MAISLRGPVLGIPVARASFCRTDRRRFESQGVCHWGCVERERRVGVRRIVFVLPCSVGC